MERRINHRALALCLRGIDDFGFCFHAVHPRPAPEPGGLESCRLPSFLSDEQRQRDVPSKSSRVSPRGRQVVHFDHIRQEVTGSRPIGGELDNTAEPFRAAFDDKATEYTNEHYQNGTATIYGKKEGGSIVVTICISSARFNPNNFWNGRWRAVWTCKFSPSGGNVDISGVLKVNVHYYEDGNVQLNTETPVKISATGTDARGLADAVVKAIDKAESNFHKALETSYNTMGDTTFKALRRVLPITRTKIDWTKIQNYKSGGDAGGKAAASRGVRG